MEESFLEVGTWKQAIDAVEFTKWRSRYEANAEAVSLPPASKYEKGSSTFKERQ